MDRQKREEIRKTAYAVGFPHNMIDELIADLEAAEEAIRLLADAGQLQNEKLQIAREALKYFAEDRHLIGLADDGEGDGASLARKALREIGE